MPGKSELRDWLQSSGNGFQVNTSKKESPSRTPVECNSEFVNLTSDSLYHFGLDTDTTDFEAAFGDTRFIITGGADKRIEAYAEGLATDFGYKLPYGCKLQNISESARRYSVYKVGPILLVSHGIGAGSASIVMNELIKLLWHAKCNDVTLFRLGTCGGIGVEPGDVIVSEKLVNGLMEPYYEQHILGEVVRKPCAVDQELVNDLTKVASSADDFRVVKGTTITTVDFYECQARRDGCICGFSAQLQREYLSHMIEATAGLSIMEWLKNAKLNRNANAEVSSNVGPRISPAKRPEECNSNLAKMEHDFLYHFGFGTAQIDFKQEFGDIKFVIIGGANKRMELYAEQLVREFGFKMPTGMKLANMVEGAGRFSMYKVGPVLLVSHGMGIGSVAIQLNELIKLLWYADCRDVTLLRLGTSGGVGVEGGTVVVTEEPLDDLLRPVYEQHILGEVVQKPAMLDKELVGELLNLKSDNDDFQIVAGKTVTGTDFYECQGRTDGAVCGHSNEDKLAFLRKIYDQGVRNFEMEATVIGALTHAVGLRAGIVCVALLNRLNGDQVTTPHSEIEKWEARPIKLVTRYIVKKLMEEGYQDNRFELFMEPHGSKK